MIDDEIMYTSCVLGEAESGDAHKVRRSGQKNSLSAALPRELGRR